MNDTQRIIPLKWFSELNGFRKNGAERFIFQNKKNIA